MVDTVKAIIHDVPAIIDLIKVYANKGLMLNRSEDEVIQNLRDYFVAKEIINNQLEIVGVASLHIYTDRLSEIKALTVSQKYQHKGIATQLVKACLQEARNLGLKKVFALTYAEKFFKSIGFVNSSKEELPEKIWKECLTCSKYNTCDEICLSIKINNQEQ